MTKVCVQTRIHTDYMAGQITPPLWLSLNPSKGEDLLQYKQPIESNISPISITVTKLLRETT